MADFDDGLVIGLAVGKKKFKGGGNDKKRWEYPKEWLPLPAPEENEVCFLIMLNKNKFEGGELWLHSRCSRQSDDGAIVDWGDGVTEDFDLNNAAPNHIYTAGNGTPLSDNVEMYIIKAAYRGTAKFDEISERDTGLRAVAAAIDGSAMSRNDQSPNGTCFYNPSCLKYLRFTGDPKYWEERIYSGFNAGTYALARVDFDFSRKVTKLPPYTFQSCMSLTDINMPDLSEVIECTNGCFDFCPCLQKISLPKLETISGTALVNNYSVQELYLPKLKTIGSDSTPASSIFQGYYCLKEMSFPSLEAVYANSWSMAFNTCYALEILDLPKLVQWGINANNTGASSYSVRSLNAPNVDTAGWFKDSVYMQ